MLYDYVTLDVFTDKTFGGNPLAVLPDARGLTTEQMQAIAREFNYSETTFVLPPEDENNTRKVRIFTPMAEIPFAGHPNVGTAVALARLDALGEVVAGQRILFEEGAEVLVGDLGWVGFDPANGISPTDKHIRVATGLDYLGASPVRGTRYGGIGEEMTVKVAIGPASKPSR